MSREDLLFYGGDLDATLRAHQDSIISEKAAHVEESEISLALLLAET
jgi:hypothetical protein